MKRLVTLLLCTAPALLQAQVKTLNQAIIHTTTTIVAPEDDESAPLQTTTTSADGGEVRVMRFGGDGETKTTTWLRNDIVKTFSESEMGRSTLIRDNNKKITTTIMEMMGRKSGFYATDEEQETMRKRMDSMMRANPNMNMNQPAGNAIKSTELVLVDEQKKIADFNAKKALLVSLRANGKTDTTTVWYSTDFKLQGLTNTGGAGGGFAGFSPQAATGMDLLPGFPLQYERNMNRGRKMTVKVTKIVIDKDIADKEFDLPKDIEIKSMKDMQGGMPGAPMQFRFGG